MTVTRSMAFLRRRRSSLKGEMRSCQRNTILVFLGGVALLWCWNLTRVLEEDEAPLDHLAAILQKPLYALNCPIIRETDDRTLKMPPAVMISARPKEQVAFALATWQRYFNLSVIRTDSFSSTYINTRCRKTAWKARLFAVYQHVFQQMISQYPADWLFLVVEDDVLLIDGPGTHRELSWVLQHNVEFYSFLPTQSDSCIFQYGTNAMAISKKVMVQLIEADVDTFCRLPIDMAIARVGPWYVTMKNLTQHIGHRFHLGGI